MVSNADRALGANQQSFTYSSSAPFPVITNNFTIYIYYFQIPFSNCHSHLQQIVLSSSWYRKHNSFRQNFLKVLFSYVNTSTYLRPFYHREWDAHFLPKASPAIHIFHPLRSLLCQSALLLPSASSPFGVLPSAYDIFKPLPCEKASPFSTLCLS